MQGKALLKQEINHRATVPVSGIAAGTYLYHVRTEKDSYQGKIVKQ
ncbi:MAG: T9SS type A sorting domain-containing protein [Bacteroidales bacterium]|jgi:hypothetical protein|nr:T9SS type A sorting domain-containing protein [Bacteroidales bacterium]